MNVQKTLIYAGVAALTAGLSQAAMVAQSLSVAPVESPGSWTASALAGVFVAAALAALPYLRAVTPPEG